MSLVPHVADFKKLQKVIPKRSYPNVRISFDLLHIIYIYMYTHIIKIYQNSKALFLESENGQYPDEKNM